MRSLLLCREPPEHGVQCHACGFHTISETTSLSTPKHPATRRETGRRRAKVAQAWATQLKHLLREMKGAVEAARAQGLSRLALEHRQAFVARYRALLATGHAANPPPERRPRQRGRV